MQQQLQDHQPERLRGLHVDDQLEPSGLLHGKVSRLVALATAPTWTRIRGVKLTSRQGRATVAPPRHRKLRGTPSGRLPPCPAVILVPGLWLWRDPWLQWAAGCAGAIRAAGSQPVWFGYSRRVAWTAFLRPTGGTAAELVRRFLTLYDRVRARHGPPSVIAHSFGTYLVARALSDFEGARLRALILFGSIVNETFDWGTIVARGQVTPARMRNEVGAHA